MDKHKRVSTQGLERSGDGSRTELELQAEAARKFSLAMSQQKTRIRPMEAVWALVVLALALGYLQKSDVSHKVIAEKRSSVEGCIAQFSAGQYHRNPKFQCAQMVEAPVTAMTRPIQ